MAPKKIQKKSPEKELKVQPKSSSVENQAKAHCSTRSSSVYAKSHTRSDSNSSDERDEVLPTRSSTLTPRKNTCPESTDKAGQGRKRGCTANPQEPQKSCSPVARKKVARKHSSESRDLKRKGIKNNSSTESMPLKRSKATSTKKGSPQRKSTSGDEQKGGRQKKGVDQDQEPGCSQAFEGLSNPRNDRRNSQCSRANCVIVCDSDTDSDSSSVICIAEYPAKRQNQYPDDVRQVQSNPDKIIRSNSGTNVLSSGDDVGGNINDINTEEEVNNIECVNDDANVVANNVLEEPHEECSSTSKESTQDLSSLTTSTHPSSTDRSNVTVNTVQDMTQDLSIFTISPHLVSTGSSIDTVNSSTGSTQNVFIPTTSASITANTPLVSAASSGVTAITPLSVGSSRVTETSPLSAASSRVTAITPLSAAVSKVTASTPLSVGPSRVTANTPLSAAVSRVFANTPWGLSALEPHADSNRDATGGFFFGAGSRLENGTLRAPP